MFSKQQVLLSLLSYNYSSNTLLCCSFFCTVFQFIFMLGRWTSQIKTMWYDPLRSCHYQVPTDFPRMKPYLHYIFILVYYCTHGNGDTLSSSMCDDTCKGSSITSSQVFVYGWLATQPQQFVSIEHSYKQNILDIHSKRQNYNYSLTKVT